MKSTKIEIRENTIFSRISDLIFSEIDNEIVILSIENEEYYYLNTVGSEIWKLIAKPESFSTIVETLSENYDVSYELCKLDTIQYLIELLELGVIELK